VRHGGTRIAAPDTPPVRELRSARRWPWVPARSALDASPRRRGDSTEVNRTAWAELAADPSRWPLAGRSGTAPSIWAEVVDC
jgi:hypothetical protein